MIVISNVKCSRQTVKREKKIYNYYCILNEQNGTEKEGGRTQKKSIRIELKTTTRENCVETKLN